MIVDVAVVGAGFSGTMVAAQLLRGAQRAGRTLRVALVTGPTRVGRGAAYGTGCRAHLLNVPAGRMSAFPDDAEHFLRYARSRHPELGPGSFVRRELYGEYVESVLEQAEAEASPAGRVERWAMQAVAIEPAEQGGKVVLRNGQTLSARKVVMAFGNFAPKDPPLEDPSAYESARYIRDPWAPRALDAIRSDDEVLALGTGLTMFDVVVDLAGRGHTGRVHAISRRGLTPLPHVTKPSPAPAPVDVSSSTALGLFRALRRAAAQAAEQGIPWQAVVDSLRGSTGTLWNRLTEDERRRFLRHLRTYWDVHRHRVPPPTDQAVQKLRAEGLLSVGAARLVSLKDVGDGMLACYVPRGRAAVETRTVQWVVNCTGPECDLERVDDPLMAALRKKRLVRPDSLRLGLSTTADGAAIDRDGRPSAWLFAIGPMRKATLWEATAVPELRAQAVELATYLLTSLDAR